MRWGGGGYTRGGGGELSFHLFKGGAQHVLPSVKRGWGRGQKVSDLQFSISLIAGL